MIKSEVKRLICSAIAELYPDSHSIEFNVEEPPSEVAVDLSSNAAFMLSRTLPDDKKAPVPELADKIASRIGEKGPIKKIEISKNGFLNFTLSDDYLRSVVAKSMRGEDESSFPAAKAGPILMEFVSANPTGPLHVGHGRGAALGDSLARIYRECGFQVQTEYYVNDMGIQMEILSKSVEAKYHQIQGKDVSFPENGYKGTYIETLGRRMLEEKRDDFSQFPKKDILAGIRRDLEDFGVCFDNWFYESSLHSGNKVEKALNLLKEKNALIEKEGALWYSGQRTSGNEEEQDKDRVLRKSDGKYTYFASDVAYHKDKFDRGFKSCIDIWGQDHHGYVPRLSSAVNSLGVPRQSLKLMLYQLVSLKRGGKRVSMSTRAGEFVTLREILDEVGRDACRFFFAMRSPSSQLEFDLDLAKKQSSENPVYYVQYLHARISSIFREAEKRKILISPAQETGEKISLELLKEIEERDLMKKIGFFGDVLENSLQIQSPHLISDYLIDLAIKFHKFYDRHRVLDAEPHLRRERLLLLGAVQKITRRALSLLGVSAPEMM